MAWGHSRVGLDARQLGLHLGHVVVSCHCHDWLEIDLSRKDNACLCDGSAHTDNTLRGGERDGAGAGRGGLAGDGMDAVVVDRQVTTWSAVGGVFLRGLQNDERAGAVPEMCPTRARVTGDGVGAGAEGLGQAWPAGPDGQTVL